MVMKNVILTGEVEMRLELDDIGVYVSRNQVSDLELPNSFFLIGNADHSHN